jgi:hypothetical protein
MGLRSLSAGFDREKLRGLSTTARAILVGSAVIGLFFGAWHTHRAIRDGKQLEISCEDYIRERPDNHWLKLTNCEYDVDNYVFIRGGRQGDGDIRKVFFALRPIGDTSGKTTIVVVRDDKETIALIETAEDGNEPSEAAVARFAADIQKPVEGIVSSGLDVDHGDKDKIEDPKLNLQLANDFVMLSNGAHPRLLLGILLLIGSTAFLGLAGALFVTKRRRARKQPPAPPPTPTPPSDEPPEPPPLAPMVVRTPPT